MTVLPEYVVGAIRLALEGAADDEAALNLTKWLVEQAPATKDGDTASVQLLIDGIQTLGYSLSTESPSGAYAPA